mgnify:CR=1 FL=1
MLMYYQGRWIDKSATIPVHNPFDGSVIDTVPKADAADVEAALSGAVEGARIMRRTSGYDRSLVLRKAAQLMRERVPDLAYTLSSEEGKTLAEARFEVGRAAETMDLSADEAKRLGGEVLALDGAPGGAGQPTTANTETSSSRAARQADMTAMIPSPACDS